MNGRKITVFGATVVVALGLAAGVASAHECTNASKPPGAGVQVIIDANTDQLVWASHGLTKRFENGLIGPDGEGFHGLVGIDFDGDGVADATTYIVTPNGEIPTQAQQNGSPTHGIVNICGGTCD